MSSRVLLGILTLAALALRTLRAKFHNDTHSMLCSGRSRGLVFGPLRPRLPANVHLGSLGAFPLNCPSPCMSLFQNLYHQPEILTLNQPSFDMLSSSIRCRGRIRYQHKTLAESSRSCCTRFSKFDATTDSHQYYHILARCWRVALSPFCNVVRIHYLTVVILDLVAGFWHLFLEQRLHRCRVWYYIPVVDDYG